jgi:hypothetical protein
MSPWGELAVDPRGMTPNQIGQIVSSRSEPFSYADSASLLLAECGYGEIQGARLAAADPTCLKAHTGTATTRLARKAPDAQVAGGEPPRRGVTP